VAPRDVHRDPFTLDSEDDGFFVFGYVIGFEEELGLLPVFRTRIYPSSCDNVSNNRGIQLSFGPFLDVFGC
jgi:hypothetical protein